ncbi:MULTISPECIES: DUF4870 domain-containing protein [Brevibacillus]|uniref:DUF4870 domain-containing protein n=1 Tax=Brevibacillus invocatus TaxID=173959 RepID=A0A3M8C9U1_9BACL|nr:MULTISPECIES: DUF4870 domain-containing protein [Brevibacillus]MCM3079922.1 DUF4870 domain-containing protein [Brevibacillus invocatus]MCM3430115.1 DUF4870 domain-containing protein [Brevibacillus invocatus]MDH4616671.1 DUF4870 domain-containing protein [Brevibacillus sp. AY1]RNB72263.1 DUF4870 domain-containing protein [Brevibacillus invocatus]
MSEHLPSSKDERTWALVAHLSALVGCFIPLGNVIGPLIVWLVKREGSEFVDIHGKEALNFNLTVTIFAAIATLLMLVLIGAFLMIALFVFWVICLIMAVMKVNEGKIYRYPITFRFIK